MSDPFGPPRGESDDQSAKPTGWGQFEQPSAEPSEPTQQIPPQAPPPPPVAPPPVAPPPVAPTPPHGPGQPYAPGFAFRPKHPQATTVLVLGILGLVVCGVLAPFAWVMGNRALSEIDANPHAWDGRGEANAGKILGIIGSVFLAVGVVFAAIYLMGIAVFIASA